VSGSLAGKVAVVTGAGSGIGRAIARRLVADGARVLAVDLSAEALASLQAELGEGLATSVASVTGDVEPILAACEVQFGRLDVLVNNAGRTTPRFAPLHELTEAEWDAVMDVNFGGALAMLRGALSRMVPAGRGAIINTVSISALKALPYGGAYSVSKAALAMLTRQAAAEYASQGIRVNGIMPGVTDTPILQEVPPETMEAIIAGIPQRRLAHPAEIAAAVSFLASDQAGYINGTLLNIDGAASA
jgi:NAD(P)-dependent dehydrogenase (short-subunit alcohol dehydrogenase family)